MELVFAVVGLFFSVTLWCAVARSCKLEWHWTSQDFSRLPFKLMLLSHQGWLCCCQALFQRFLFFTESSCSNLPAQLWILTEMSLYCYWKSDLGWLIHCALNTLFWHLSTICPICLILKMHRSTALKAHAKHHVFVNDCIPWVLSVHVGSCCQSAAVFMGRTVALLSSTHFVFTELFLFSSLFPYLLSIVSFVCYVCTQVGLQVLDEFRGSLKSIRQWTYKRAGDQTSGRDVCCRDCLL